MKKEENKKTEEKEKNLKELEAKCEEYLNGWKRERADFLNYKKEEMERIGGLIKYASLETILKILPILDNFDIAEKKIPDALKNDENVKGFFKIKQQIKEFLESQGIEEIKTLGEKFDPNLMEAVAEADKKNKEGKGVVVEEVQKGYTSQSKIIRPAKVKVAK